jgi:hypothetical protein
LSGAKFSTGNASTPASTGGEAAHALVASEIPAAFLTDAGAIPFPPPGPPNGESGNPNSGGNNVHNTMPPFMLGTWYMFL